MPKKNVSRKIREEMKSKNRQNFSFLYVLFFSSITLSHRSFVIFSKHKRKNFPELKIFFATYGCGKNPKYLMSDEEKR